MTSHRSFFSPAPLGILVDKYLKNDTIRQKIGMEIEYNEKEIN